MTPRVTSLFWRNIWPVPVCHAETDRLCDGERVCDTLLEMERVEITPLDVARAVRPLPNWKCPERKTSCDPRAGFYLGQKPTVAIQRGNVEAWNVTALKAIFLCYFIVQYSF